MAGVRSSWSHDIHIGKQRGVSAWQSSTGHMTPTVRKQREMNIWQSSAGHMTPELPMAEAQQPLPSSFLWGLPTECAVSRGGTEGGKGSRERDSCRNEK